MHKPRASTSPSTPLPAATAAALPQPRLPLANFEYSDDGGARYAQAPPGGTNPTHNLQSAVAVQETKRMEACGK
eukprot:1960840-Pyramimonas_sp.AAC.1